MSKIILINGPSGAGKTTTAKAFLEHAKAEWAYIGQDDMHGLIRSGYRSANDLAETWDDDIKRQWEFSVALSCDSIKRCVEYGINCIVDFFAPLKEFQKWSEQLNGYEYIHFILLPGLPVTLDRNQQREDNARLSNEKIRANYALFAGQHYDHAQVLDTSGLEPNGVALQLGKYSFEDQ